MTDRQLVLAAAMLVIMADGFRIMGDGFHDLADTLDARAIELRADNVVDANREVTDAAE